MCRNDKKIKQLEPMNENNNRVYQRRSVFEEHFTDLKKDLFRMKNLVCVAVERSIEALEKRNLVQAREVRKNDQEINDLRWKIEEKCIHLIATQQPVATDLRELIAILNIITDLERMGDYASGISKIVIRIGDEEPIKRLIDIPRMAEISVEMIHESLNAYELRDDKAARETSARDDMLDELYKQIQRELISIMIEDPKKITRSTYLLWVSHNLERIGDRVTNICERIVFLVTGEMTENISND
jgi:phosphate transport system protein